MLGGVWIEVLCRLGGDLFVVGKVLRVVGFLIDCLNVGDIVWLKWGVVGDESGVGLWVKGSVVVWVFKELVFSGKLFCVLGLVGGNVVEVMVMKIVCWFWIVFLMVWGYWMMLCEGG